MKKQALLALSLSIGLGLTACGGNDGSATATSGGGGRGDGGGKCPANLTLAFVGAQTGPNAQLGINESNGMQIALDEWNKANTDCQVKIEVFDTAGEPAQANLLAPKVVANQTIIGVIGLPFSGESKTANPIFDEAGVPLISPSATNPQLSKKDWKVFHRAVGNDNAQGPAAAKYMKNTLNAKKVAVLDENTEYGKGIADIVRKNWKDGGGEVAVSDSIDPKATDYSAVVNKVKAANVDAIFFGGYYDEGGRLLKQMRDAGIKASFVGPDGINDELLVKGAGAANAEGVVALAPAGDIAKAEGGAAFVKAHEAKYSKKPGLYGAEAYDGTKHYLAGIKAENLTRESLNNYISNTEYKGITKTFKYGSDGELSGEVTIHAYKVKTGKIEYDGPVK